MRESERDSEHTGPRATGLKSVRKMCARRGAAKRSLEWGVQKLAGRPAGAEELLSCLVVSCFASHPFYLILSRERVADRIRAREGATKLDGSQSVLLTVSSARRTLRPIRAREPSGYRRVKLEDLSADETGRRCGRPLTYIPCWRANINLAVFQRRLAFQAAGSGGELVEADLRTWN